MRPLPNRSTASKINRWPLSVEAFFHLLGRYDQNLRNPAPGPRRDFRFSVSVGRHHSTALRGQRVQAVRLGLVTVTPCVLLRGKLGLGHLSVAEMRTPPGGASTGTEFLRAN
jgi:hypothetical protein